MPKKKNTDKVKKDHKKVIKKESKRSALKKNEKKGPAKKQHDRFNASKPKKKSKDPFHVRESQLYEFPIPSREFIIAHIKSRKTPITYNQLENDLNLKREEEIEGLTRRLSAMLRDGQLVLNGKNQYSLPDRTGLIAGFIQAHRDGFGWLIPEAGGSDIFLPAHQMRQVFSDDKVLVRVLSKSGRRPEGAIIEILERNTQHLVGRFHNEGGVCFVEPDSKTIFHQVLIPKGSEKRAKNGEFVTVNIVAQPSSRRQPIGEVIDILGDQLTPGMEVELAIRAHNLPYQFPAEVMSEAGKLPKKVVFEPSNDRRDLRALYFVTIDGEDAKDFDDAVYCEPREEGGWKVFVAIADVAHYVTPNTALDKEAYLRGNSVYFPGRVIPMLPEKLSNDLCSLRPNCDRLTMVAEIHLTEKGEVISSHFDNAVIHSKNRLTYTEVAAILEGKKAESVLTQHLKNLQAVYKKLLLIRKMRGAIEFETTETQVVFGSGGKIDRIIPRTRNEAHRIIEELMLLANEMTSTFLEKSKLPILYRIHDLPDEAKLNNLREFLKSFSLRLQGGEKPTSIDFAKLLDRVAKRKEAQLIQTIMLRSLKQAIYSTDNRGHFGLAYESYCHFTSPIRRYPDLLIHRALKHAIQKRKGKFAYERDVIEGFGEHCSTTERRADRASRDALDWLKCDYMQSKLGEVFDGVITDVTGFGLFVELKDVYVQGLLHITSLKSDYYQFDSTHHLLRGKRGGAVYRLGDPVTVQVARVDLDVRKIDFVLADAE